MRDSCLHVLVAQARSLWWRPRAEGDIDIPFTDEKRALVWLSRFTDEPYGRATLRRLLSEIDASDFGLCSESEVIRRMAVRLSSGRVRAVRPMARLFNVATGGEEATSPRHDVTVVPKLSWISISLVDDADPPQPVPDQPYLITLPDGSTRRGTLDENGYAIALNIKPGDCRVSFPDLHAPDWKPRA